MTARRLRVLVVDDSAVVRQTLLGLLRRDGRFEVDTAPDPIFAMDKLRRAAPDVIVLDLEMPRMDGLSFLRWLMSEHPLPVVVCSAIAGDSREAALEALELGAVEVIAKPRIGLRDFLEESAVLLTDAVLAAARAHRPRPRPPAPPPPVVPRLSADALLPRPEGRGLRVTTDKVVALGASTGGTEALRTILEAMPPDAPAMVVVQHMPEGFTRSFAERLDRSCRIEVKEAQAGDRMLEGRALIAPGNRHTLLRRSGAHYVVDVVDGPLVSRHRPSVDALFRSVAIAAGPNAVGVILTGMGDDGAEGLLEMKRAGAATLAQNERTCVVFGMPKEAIARGAVDEVISLDRVAHAILQRRHGAPALRSGIQTP